MRLRTSAPCSTNLTRGLWLNMPAEFGSQRRQKVFGKCVFFSRLESRIEGGSQNMGENGLFERGLICPTDFTTILDKSGIALQIRILPAARSKEISLECILLKCCLGSERPLA
jgi:hypothetical protein